MGNPSKISAQNVIAPSKIKNSLISLFKSIQPQIVKFDKIEALEFLKESEYNRKDGYLIETECNPVIWNKLSDG